MKNNPLRWILGLILFFQTVSGFSSEQNEFNSQGLNFKSKKHHSKNKNLIPPSQGDFLSSFAEELYKKMPHITSEEGVTEWTPNGALFPAVKAECLPEAFEKKALNSNLSQKEFATLTQEFFEKCGESLHSTSTNGIVGLLEFARARYPFLQNSRMQTHKFKTKNGMILNGFIGVKDNVPRPWVIYKCGVFCSAEETGASIKNYLIHLFDQAPFNIILLGNNTGKDYIRENGTFHFGGYYESQDFTDVARWLRNESPYKNIVSSVHVVAVSLASSAALMSDLNIPKSPQNQNLIQSISSLCGVVDLKPTVNDMYQDSIKGEVFSSLTWNEFQAVRGSLKGSSEVIPSAKPANSAFPKILGELVLTYSNDLESKKFSHTEHELEEFWKENQYTQKAQAVSSPIFVWASEDDSVVSYPINTGNLSKMGFVTHNPSIGLVRVPFGDHCGFATAYGYPVVSSILRTHILNHSPEFLKAHQEVKMDLPIRKISMIEGEYFIKHWWTMGFKPGTIELKFRVYGEDDSLCPKWMAFENRTNCIREEKLVYSQADFVKYGMLNPKNEIERQALVRELNARIRLSFDGDTVIETANTPNEMILKY